MQVEKRAKDLSKADFAHWTDRLSLRLGTFPEWTYAMGVMAQVQVETEPIGDAGFRELLGRVNGKDF